MQHDLAARPAPQRAAAPRSAAARDVSLDFLQPATDTAYLGRLAHFDVMRVLGRGGMGVVLEAFDSRLQRNVALKVLDPELAGDEIARQRFCREARAAASITHENVVAVHQVEKSIEDGLPYLVMQLIAGESLEQRLAREKNLPLREIVRIGMQAAHGLAAAHEQGLIHRDIKPGNILLEPPHDRVKLTDFGLARVAEDVKLTHTGFVTGTPLYMAPEQAMGEPGRSAAPTCSAWARCCTRCAPANPRSAGNSALAILKQIVETKHRPLRELNPAMPDWLAQTIDRLLAKKPADRIQSAAQLAELLDFEWALMKTSSEDVPTVCKIEPSASARSATAGLPRRLARLSWHSDWSAAGSWRSRDRRAAAATAALGRAHRQCRRRLVGGVRSGERHGGDGRRRWRRPLVGFADQERQIDAQCPPRHRLVVAVLARTANCWPPPGTMD